MSQDIIQENEHNDIHIKTETDAILNHKTPETLTILQPRYVLGFAMNSERTKVLLITKNRPIWQAGHLNGIGGKIEEFDASPAHAISREFEEETGLIISHEYWKPFGNMDSPHFHVSLFWAESDILEYHKSITDEIVSLVDIQDLLDNRYKHCIPNLSWIIGVLLDPQLERIQLNLSYSA